MSDQTHLLQHPSRSYVGAPNVSPARSVDSVLDDLTNRDSRKGKGKGKCRSPNTSPAKLGTFDGVFFPTALNVLSILMFLRFGFVMGQMGIAGTILLLLMSYFIDLLTVLSVSAISTNGTVRGGGAYYMILRSLGPEFGVAIGIIFFIGQVLNTSLNVVGLIEPFLENFGKPDGVMLLLLPFSYLWRIAYSSMLLAICTVVAMIGSSLVSKTAFCLFVVLTTSTLSIPVSALFVKPFYPLAAPDNHILYTGLSWDTFKGNFWTEFSTGAAGSLQPKGIPENFRNMFGIFFPATAGIFAGASMSGELKTPSKSIPKGTLSGLLVTFILYLLVIISLGSSTPRELLRKDLAIMQTINLHGIAIVMGEVATSLFSVIMGIVGAASMLNAVANDKIVPGLQIFSVNHKLEKENKKAQLYGVIFTWFLAQVFLFANINQIATFITMAFSMTFMVTNLACFLLRVGSAPNFRPSFKYFSSRTALMGGAASVVAMYICDGWSATSVIVFLVFLIMMIHYSAPPLKFGDISQLLIYHQVRKYLLRLKLNMSVKYWRPQILLLCDDPRTSWNLIGFCNHLKKGGLYMLGHVVIISDKQLDQNLDFGIQAFKEVQKQKLAWIKLRDIARIKAFVHISIGPSLPWGVRNVFLGSGLGGMKPNITVLGFHDCSKHMTLKASPQRKQNRSLPTDNLRKEQQVSISQWVQIVEDLIIMQATVAVAANFDCMSVPELKGLWLSDKFDKVKREKRYIDLYPIQMSNMCLLADGKSVLSTNFDTYTLILQLGSILSTVDEWKKNNYVLRVIAFVETKGEEEDEQLRLVGLLEKLRIEAEVKVLCLSDGLLESYNIIVSGQPITQNQSKVYKWISDTLRNDQWWNNLVESRKIVREVENNRIRKRNTCKSQSIVINDDVSKRLNNLSLGSFSYAGENKFGASAVSNKRYALSNLHGQGMALSLNMRAQGGDFFYDSGNAFASSDESSSEREGAATKTSSTSIYFNVPLKKKSEPMRPVKHVSLCVPLMSALNLNMPLNALLSMTAPGALSLDLDGRQKSTQQENPSVLQKTHKNDLAITSSEKLPSRPLKVKLRPNFSAVMIPEAKVQEDDADEENVDGDDSEEPAKSSIAFVDEYEEENDNDDNDDFEDNEIENEDQARDQEGRSLSGPGDYGEKKSELYPDSQKYPSFRISMSSRPFLSGPACTKPKTSRRMSTSTPSRQPSSTNMKTARPKFQFDLNTDLKEDLCASSIISEDMLPERLRSPHFLNESGEDLPPSLESPFKKNECLLRGKDLRATLKKLQRELLDFLFNKLPPNGQHLILNELMRLHLNDAAVIFSTLPAPEIGTHLNPDESYEYAKSLAIWLADLPPVLLLNSQTITVTTSL